MAFSPAAQAHRGIARAGGVEIDGSG